MKESCDIDIGFVSEVNGEKALVELTVDTTEPVDGEYYAGQIGSHVKIPVLDKSVVGMVATVRVVDPKQVEPGDGCAPRVSGRRVAEVLMVGTIDSKGFTRGVVAYPVAGQRVKVLRPDELGSVYSTFVDKGFSFGRAAALETQRAHVQVDRLFGQHLAVVGTTGCGKSCTVVSMLQQAVKKYDNTHIIVLDLHGEYSAAFGDETMVIEADKVELPYWLLSFDEFIGLTVDPDEPTARNQVTVLRDAIVRARQNTVISEKMDASLQVTVDSPVYYSLEEMIAQLRNWNIQMVYDNNGMLVQGPLYGTFDRFLIRFDTRLVDPRYQFIFDPGVYTDNKALPQLLRDFLSIGTGKRMTVIDLSGIPSDTVGIVVAVVSRIAFEFNLWNPEHDRFPVLMVYEEAHNYVPNRTDPKFAAARAAVERIMKEGRKYGVGAVVVSQRPKELSETILAQCNNYVVMRLTNPDDQAYVRRLVPDSSVGLLAMLPVLRTGEALILGDSVVMPTRVLVDLPDPRPRSDDVEYGKWWTAGLPDLDVDRVIKRWRGRSRDF
jgi:energy-coupling factor transporter ATP-binding protein EcfA2